MKQPVIQPANTSALQECVPHRAKLAVASCAKRWERSQVDDNVAREQLTHCRSCAVGERNAATSANGR